VAQAARRQLAGAVVIKNPHIKCMVVLRGPFEPWRGASQLLCIYNTCTCALQPVCACSGLQACQLAVATTTATAAVEKCPIKASCSVWLLAYTSSLEFKVRIIVPLRPASGLALSSTSGLRNQQKLAAAVAGSYWHWLPSTRHPRRQ
jgi:hypothetical protein